jgi:protocatechuate 4,5-dioxygenase beta chain
MARIIGGVGVSHVPAIGNAMAKGLQQEPYWKPFFDGVPPVRRWLLEERPDVAVVFYNDHGLNFFLNNLPTFAVGAAAEYRNADEGWGLPVIPPFKGDVELSWHIIEQLVDAEFDVATCQEVLVDHALVNPMRLFWPDEECPVRIVPVMINTVQHPLPSAARCFKLGQAVGRAIGTYEGADKVVVFGTGGLSHQLDGQRAGFINKEFDRLCLDKIESAPEELLRYDTHELVKLAGTQGVEILNWIAMRGALTGKVDKLHQNYHVPISNTASGLLLLANQ